MSDPVSHRELKAERKRVDDLRSADQTAVNAALAAAEKAVSAALTSAEKATQLVAHTSERDAAKQNEWRAAMDNLIAAHREALATIVATLPTRKEMDLRMEAQKRELDGEHDRLGERITSLEGGRIERRAADDSRRISRAQMILIAGTIGAFSSALAAVLINLLGG